MTDIKPDYYICKHDCMIWNDEDINNDIEPCPNCTIDALMTRVKELELKLAKMLSKQDTLRCYMCDGSNYLEWVDWDTFDEDHKQKYIKQAEEK